MGLHFVTGPSGAGKTTLEQEFARRWYETVDTDDPKKEGYSALFEKATGQLVARYNEFSFGKDGIDMETHVWGMTDWGIETVRARVDETFTPQDVLLFGRLRELSGQLVDALDLVFYLQLSNDSIATRLEERAQNATADTVLWGSEDWQIEFSVSQNAALTAEYATMGAIMINAERETRIIADDIVGHMQAA